MLSIVKLMRPHQYIKNGFVFLGLIFSHQWGFGTLCQALLIFFAFCLMASAVYVLNDILDVEADRAHPIKVNRPIPSGKVSLQSARFMVLFLVLGALTISVMVNMWVFVFSLSYFVLNVFYSWKFKHVVILDVFLISAGFMLRILAGTVGLDIPPSAWLLLCGLMVTLFLGFSKRRAELLVVENTKGANGALMRRVLDDYSPAMLEQFIAVTAACTILSYGLYTVSPQTIETHGTDALVYTIPFVVYGIFRYLFLLHHRERGSDTAKDLVQDRHMLLTVAAWLGSTIWVLM